MTDIFISYSSQDEQIANKICENFEKEGFCCWIAPRNIQPGKEYGEEIIKGIEESEVFFLCLSNSANESQHVLREVERAVNRNLPIIVYQQEETQLSKSLEYFLAATQWFIPNENNGMDELIGTVEKLRGGKRTHKSELPKLTEAKNKKQKWIPVVVVAVAVCLLVLGVFIFSGRKIEV